MKPKLVGAAVLSAALLLAGCADATSGAAPGGTKSPPIADATPGAVQPGAATDAGVTPAETATGAADAAEGSTVLTVVEADPQFSTFVRLVKAAGLEQTLELPGPLTVFAPTNEAFEALPPGLVQQLLTPTNKEPLTFIAAYHVVEKDITSGDLTGDVTALSGQTLTLSSSDGGTVNGIAVVQPDISAANGVVHGIDGVLVPPDVDLQAVLEGQ